MCGLLPLMASGKVKPGDVAAGTFGLAGLAAKSMLKKDKPKSPSQTFYGTPGG